MALRRGERPVGTPTLRAWSAPTLRRERNLGKGALRGVMKAPEQTQKEHNKRNCSRRCRVTRHMGDRTPTTRSKAENDEEEEHTKVYAREKKYLQRFVALSSE